MRLRNTSTRPAAKKAEPMIDTTQCSSGPFVQANQNSPMGSRTEPIRAGGSLASGAAMPPRPAETLAYRALSKPE